MFNTGHKSHSNILYRFLRATNFLYYFNVLVTTLEKSCVCINAHTQNRNFCANYLNENLKLDFHMEKMQYDSKVTQNC